MRLPAAPREALIFQPPHFLYKKIRADIKNLFTNRERSIIIHAVIKRSEDHGQNFSGDLTADYLLCRSDNPDSTASAAAAARAFLANLRALTDKAELALEALEEDKA